MRSLWFTLLAGWFPWRVLPPPVGSFFLLSLAQLLCFVRCFVGFSFKGIACVPLHFPALALLHIGFPGSFIRWLVVRACCVWAWLGLGWLVCFDRCFGGWCPWLWISLIALQCHGKTRCSSPSMSLLLLQPAWLLAVESLELRTWYSWSRLDNTTYIHTYIYIY
jgi:hypothetical protein